MNQVGAFTSSMYQRSGINDYFRHHESGVFRAGSQQPSIQPGSTTHVLIGLNAVSLLVIMSILAFARVRRRLLRAVYHYLALYPSPAFADNSKSHQNAKKAPKKSPPKTFRKKASKRRLETQPDAESETTETQTQHNVAEGAVAPGVLHAAAHSVSASPDDDDDLQDYEIIHTGDTFSDNEDHAN